MLFEGVSPSIAQSFTSCSILVEHLHCAQNAHGVSKIDFLRNHQERGSQMKITMDKNLVEFLPENEDETAMMEALWQLMVDCVRFNKKLVPVGEYIPQKKNLARFVVEG